MTAAEREVPAASRRGQPTSNLDAAPSGRASRLSTPRVVLIGLDAAALTLAWAASLLVGVSAFGPAWEGVSAFETFGVVSLSMILSAVLLMHFDLYRSRLSSYRSAEVAALLRATTFLVPSIILIDLVVTDAVHFGFDLTAATFTLISLLIGRSLYDGWIRDARVSGKYCRQVVIVGGGPGADELLEMLGDHAETGYRVAGIIGPRSEEASAECWLGPATDLLWLMDAVGANGAFVVADELDPATRAVTLDELQGAGHHIHITVGIAGVSTDRVVIAPVAHEPLLYIRASTFSRAQAGVKRGLDLTLGITVALLTAPLWLVGAALVKLEDGGPVFFRQERVGLGRRHFKVWKLRTMAVGAEHRVDEVMALNERNGPLLKVARDPRVTRVGRVLRATSIDELPQLWNVLRGDMSLVGPRPALPSEVDTFDEELQSRHGVRPGITGLWQVEARDNPSFAAYRRLDLFYVRNISLSFDLTILLLTAQAVLARVLKRRPAEPDIVETEPDMEPVARSSAA